ncbi:MAG TPA: ion channel [Thermoanaerobaculia bacterium]|nr:ion channel [Thermoanaerobaculia bacterium]
MVASDHDPATLTPRTDDVDADLGFGSVVPRESRQRLLNRDGSFNVRREGAEFWNSLSLYHYLLTISWPRFLGVAAAAYVATNAVFAVAYLACGPAALSGADGLSLSKRLAAGFFFSVHTLATIGYGTIAPANTAANVVVVIEAFMGIVAFALIAGIVFARFSRPMAQIMFSRQAVVGPYRNGSALMFRIANERSNELVQLEARVMLARRRSRTTQEREFIPLRLERDRVMFFPLAWTVVHPIDGTSPLYGVTPEQFRESESEILILLNGFDETFSQTVHARSSYVAGEVAWGARFGNAFIAAEDGRLGIDIRRLHEIEPA